MTAFFDKLLLVKKKKKCVSLRAHPNNLPATNQIPWPDVPRSWQWRPSCSLVFHVPNCLPHRLCLSFFLFFPLFFYFRDYPRNSDVPDSAFISLPGCRQTESSVDHGTMTERARAPARSLAREGGERENTERGERQRSPRRLARRRSRCKCTYIAGSSLEINNVIKSTLRYVV